MKHYNACIAAAFLSLSLYGMARAETLTIDPAKSTAEFSVSNMGVNTVHGRFKQLAGKIDYNAKSPTKSAVVVAIQTDSIDTGNEKRDKHLRSSDFFDTARFPQITYVSQTIEQTGDSYVMKGTLIIRDVMKPIPVTFTFEPTPQSKGKTLLKAVGHTSIQREDFGITYGNGFTVGHKVTIKLTVEAH